MFARPVLLARILARSAQARWTSACPAVKAKSQRLAAMTRQTALASALPGSRDLQATAVCARRRHIRRRWGQQSARHALPVPTARRAVPSACVSRGTRDQTEGLVRSVFQASSRTRRGMPTALSAEQASTPTRPQQPAALTARQTRHHRRGACPTRPVGATRARRAQMEQRALCACQASTRSRQGQRPVMTALLESIPSQTGHRPKPRACHVRRTQTRLRAAPRWLRAPAMRAHQGLLAGRVCCARRAHSRPWQGLRSAVDADPASSLAASGRPRKPRVLIANQASTRLQIKQNV